jgi:hypothetical protein
MNERALHRLRAGFREITQALSELIDGDDWVDQRTSPLGRRQHCDAARSGRLRAKKLKGRWLARRADVDAYIEEHGLKPPVEREEADDETAKAEILQFVRTYKPRRRRKVSGT